MPDAIVIGAGPNGLVSANLLADQGWSVLVLEANAEPGGAVRSSELMEPGFINDHCSAFYPLAAGSPVVQSLELERYGLEWRQAPLVLAHPAADGTCPSFSTDIDDSVQRFNHQGAGDGESWRRSYDLWNHVSDDFIAALFKPFPPVRNGLRLMRSMPPKELVRFARFAVLPVRTMGNELFSSEANRRLLAGMALHADLLPESSISGFYGWLLGMLGQDVGWPVPKGGAGNLTAALVKRLKDKGGTLICGARVTGIVVRRGRAVGVRDVNGEDYAADKAILADVEATNLYLSLLPESAVPADVMRDISRFERDTATVKVDWNLDGPIPWAAEEARQAGTVHLVDTVDRLSQTTSELARSLVPEVPFLLLGQQSMTDETRAPAGKETAWAYTHVPTRISGDSGGTVTGRWDDSEKAQMAERMENEIERVAPGFRDLIRTRHISSPRNLEQEDANLVDGAINGGTAQLHQQLIFRPIPGMGRPETAVSGLFLASSSAHPGGGVHGACGANAAQAALSAERTRRFRRAAGWAAKKLTDQHAPPVP